MNDLVEEYFKRELSAPEEAQLTRLLDQSPDAASRMADRMAELYRQSGQAEPQWAEHALPTSFWSSIGSWIPLSLLALLNLGLIALLVHLVGIFLNYHSPMPASSVTRLPEDHPSLELRVVPVEKKASRIPPALSVPVPSFSYSSPPVPPVPTASNLSVRGKQFEQLSMVVDNPEAGLATVRVFDADHVLIRHLFNGMLPAGKQIFTWDGTTDSGTPAPPGAYSFEIQSGERTIQSKVRIKDGIIQ